MTPVKLGLIGCGRIVERVHLPRLSRRPALVVALADTDERRLDAAAARAPEARRYRDYRELLSESDATAVLLALPPALQASAAVEAFEAGKHVYLEKPGATTPEEVSSVLRAWRAAGTVGVLGLNQHYHPMYGDLREAVAQGTTGELAGMRSVFCAAARELPPWKRSRSTGGGVLLDLAIHHVDLARFVLSREIEEVAAVVRSVRSEGDTATLTLRTTDGIPVQVFVSMSAAEQDRLEVYGAAGRLAADRYGSGRLRFFGPERPTSRGQRAGALVRRSAAGAIQAIFGTPDPSHANALAAFLAAAAGPGSPPLVDLEDGYRSLAVIFAAEASAGQQGAPAAVGPTDARAEVP